VKKSSFDKKKLNTFLEAFGALFVFCLSVIGVMSVGVVVMYGGFNSVFTVGCFIVCVFSAVYGAEAWRAYITKLKEDNENVKK